MKPETQIPTSNQSQAQQLQIQPLEFEAPCCESIRECNIRKVYVIGIKGRPRVLRVIDAVRCSRGVRRKFKFYPSADAILISYYRSNRGNHYITIMWKPESLAEGQAKAYAALVLGLYSEEEVVI